MRPSNLGPSHASSTSNHPESRRDTLADASVPDFVPHANAAKRAGLTGRDVIRLRAQAQLEGASLFEVPKFERVIHVNPRDIRGSHRAQAAAKLINEPLPAPFGTRHSARIQEPIGSAAPATPVAATQKATAGQGAAEGVAPELGERKA